MSRSRRAAAVCAALVVALVGCGDSGSSKAQPEAKRTAPTKSANPYSDAPKPAASKAEPTGKRVTLHSSDYGTILADGRGRALYLFTHDTNKSRCYGACATAWPPFLTKGQPRAAGKVQQDLLGTVKRSDGTTQATYKGHPLYYYVTDKAPGQVTCQAVQEHGGYWYVVDRKGDAIR